MEYDEALSCPQWLREHILHEKIAWIQSHKNASEANNNNNNSNINSNQQEQQQQQQQQKQQQQQRQQDELSTAWPRLCQQVHKIIEANVN